MRIKSEVGTLNINIPSHVGRSEKGESAWRSTVMHRLWLPLEDSTEREKMQEKEREFRVLMLF